MGAVGERVAIRKLTEDGDLDNGSRGVVFGRLIHTDCQDLSVEATVGSQVAGSWISFAITQGFTLTAQQQTRPITC